MTAFIAIGLGLVFGFALQKSGLGNYDKVVNQFRFKDNTMVFFMMMAVGVGAVCTLALQASGVLDGSTINEGFLASALIGGLILGVGMAVAGTCPGTIFAGIGQGSLDYLIPGVLGMIAGALVYGLTFDSIAVPLWDCLYTGQENTAELLGISPWILVAALLAAVGVLYLIYRKLGKKTVGMATMALVGVLMLAGCGTQGTSDTQASGAGDGTGTGAGASSSVYTATTEGDESAQYFTDSETVSPHELDVAIKAQVASSATFMEVLDVRRTVDYVNNHVPNSLNIPLKQLQQGLRLNQVISDGVVVIVGSDESEAKQGKQALVDNGFDASKIKVLEGGYQSWVDAGLTVDGGQKIGC